MFKGLRVHNQTTARCQFILSIPRHTSLILCEKVKQEIQCIERLGYIRILGEQNDTVVQKLSGSICICMDLKPLMKV